MINRNHSLVIRFRNRVSDTEKIASTGCGLEVATCRFGTEYWINASGQLRPNMTPRLSREVLPPSLSGRASGHRLGVWCVDGKPPWSASRVMADRISQFKPITPNVGPCDEFGTRVWLFDLPWCKRFNSIALDKERDDDDDLRIGSSEWGLAHVLISPWVGFEWAVSFI